MIEELKQLLNVVEKMPEMVLWVIAGFGIYKLVVYLSTTGAIYITLRLLIEKIHDAKTRPQVKTVEVSLDKRFIINDGTLIRFYEVIDLVHMHRSKESAFPSSYLHGRDIEWLRNVVKEAIAVEQINKGKKP